jgi:hypothetical protein
MNMTEQEDYSNCGLYGERSVWLIESMDNGSESFLHGAYSTEGKAWRALSDLEVHVQWSSYLQNWTWHILFYRISHKYESWHGIWVRKLPLDQPASPMEAT